MAEFLFDDVDDSILLQASQMYEESLKDHNPEDDCSEVDDAVDNRFGKPVTEEDIVAQIESAVPKSTRKTTSWGVKIWETWIENRSRIGTDIPPYLEYITNEQLNYWLARFVMEVRNQKGEPYTGGALYGICAAIQRYIREKRAVNSQGEYLDIYKDSKLAHFRSVLDGVLKDLHRKGIGTFKKRAQIISSDLEEQLWQEDILGDDNPQKLLDTLVFCLGLNLALRSGQEHRQLRPDMFTLMELSDSSRFILVVC